MRPPLRTSALVILLAIVTFATGGIASAAIAPPPPGTTITPPPVAVPDPAPAPAPAPPRLAVRPAHVRAGERVRVFGNVAGGCARGDQVTLISRAFAHRYDFAGLPAIFTAVRRGGAFSVRTRIPLRRGPGRYRISARCGGGNLGVSARVRVLRAAPRFTG